MIIGGIDLVETTKLWKEIIRKESEHSDDTATTFSKDNRIRNAVLEATTSKMSTTTQRRGIYGMVYSISHLESEHNEGQSNEKIIPIRQIMKKP